MRIKRTVVAAGLLTLGGSLLVPASAEAGAFPPHLQASPTTVLPGQAIEFSLYCAGTPGPITSPGLVAPVPNNGYEGTGTGKAGRHTGHFTASFSCQGFIPQYGGKASAEFTIACTLPPPEPTPPPTTSTPTSPSGPPPSSRTSSSPTSRSIAPSAFRAATGDCDGAKSQIPVKPKGGVQTGDGSLANGPTRTATPEPGPSRATIAAK
jgi:hypothetical protein